MASLTFTLCLALSASEEPIELVAGAEPAIERGLRWLVAQQEEDGSWKDPNHEDALGLTGLALLAFVSTGHLPEDGPFHASVDRGATHLLDSAMGPLLTRDRNAHEMYDHGFCLTALAELYGSLPDPRMQTTLTRAVTATLGAQASDGGWGYTTAGRSRDLSLTALQLLSLRVARDSGFTVPQRAVDAGLRFARTVCADGDGGFGYNNPTARPTMTAAGALVLAACDPSESANAAVLRALERLTQEFPEFDPVEQLWFYYGAYYATQASVACGKPIAGQLYQSLCQRLLTLQRDDGSWFGRGEGAVMATSMAILSLSLPLGYLPSTLRAADGTN